MEAMDHPRCSELLPAYDRAELGASDAAAVEAHLASCEECSLELSGIRALHAVAVDPMTSGERSELHRRIAAATSEPATQTEVVVPAKPSFWARVAPALGGIALLVVVVSGVAMMAGSGDETASDGSGGADFGTAEDSAAEGGGVGAGESAPAVQGDQDGADVTWAGEIGRVSERRLSRDVRRERFPLTGRTAALVAADAERVSATKAAETTLRYSLALQDAAGDANAAQIEECAESVSDALPYPTVPVYGALAELDGRMVLLLGFNWAKEEGKPLNEVMLWAWPVGDCAIPVFYGAGTPRE